MNRWRLAVAFVLLGSAAFGQQVISARSGLIHYVEGRVLLDGKPVEVKITAFPEIKENMEFRTEDGRAEVLLNPGVFLRLGENSAIRMVSNKLSDSRVEFLSGSAVIESSGDLDQRTKSPSLPGSSEPTHGSMRSCFAGLSVTNLRASSSGVAPYFTALADSR